MTECKAGETELQYLGYPIAGSIGWGLAALTALIGWGITKPSDKLNLAAKREFQLYRDGKDKMIVGKNKLFIDDNYILTQDKYQQLTSDSRLIIVDGKKFYKNDDGSIIDKVVRSEYNSARITSGICIGVFVIFIIIAIVVAALYKTNEATCVDGKFKSSSNTCAYEATSVIGMILGAIPAAVLAIAILFVLSK